MNIKLRVIASLAALLVTTASMKAQEFIVVMNQDYSYEDPRWNHKVTLKKGDVISVLKNDDSYQYYGGYTAASVDIPKHVFHIPGSVKGEKCIVVNGTNVRLREKPSTKSGIYCYDENNGGSVARYKFKLKPGVEVDEDGYQYGWQPYYLDKGTRLPYLGKSNGFYKSTFNGVVFYISARYTYVK